jgi:uncharacterized protein (DUF2235 family)
MEQQRKNIIVLCDGTANQVNVRTSTNVVRVARRLDKTDNNGVRQVVFYDPGLGTEHAPGALTGIGRSITKILGLAFGYGLGKNLGDAYAFLMQNYEPGDRIYIFGFSRGAYTARALTGLLSRVGLLDRGNNSLIPYVIKYYREGNDYQLNFFKKRFSRTYALTRGQVIPEPWEDPQSKFMKESSKGVIPVHFLGVWDTVSSIGIFRKKTLLPDTDWLPNMVNGRHAVAIHEQRSQYQPELWTADTEDEKKHDEEAKKRKDKGLYQFCLHQDVKTRWFPGVHADVGGGYGLSGKKLANSTKEKEQQETALASYSLKWMIDAAKACGLRIDMKKEDQEFLDIEKPTKHNPLIPFWWILWWWPRVPGKKWEKES